MSLPISDEALLAIAVLSQGGLYLLQTVYVGRLESVLHYHRIPLPEPVGPRDIWNRITRA